jgi:uncharacterized membrane protein YqjE
VIKESIAKFLKLDSLWENLTGYVETRIELMKYDMKEDLSRVLSKVSVLLFVIVMATFFLFFLSMAVAYQIAKYLGHFWGFAIVGAVYCTIALVLFSQREKIGARIEKEIKEAIKQKKK